mgnify:CR=1 FL=1
MAKHDDKINKEVAKAAKRFGESFDEAQFRSTNGRVLEHQAKRDALHTRFAKALNDNNLEELRQIIIDEEIVCPISGTKNWTEVRQFNLMFSTEMGSTADGSMKIYLRPETAQGIFVNYLNVQKTGRMKVPFGIAQIGKAFRNEIVARQFIFRMREFEQMEMQLLSLIKAFSESFGSFRYFLIDFIVIFSQLIFNQYVGTIAFLGIFVVNQWVIECVNVSGSLPDSRMHKYGRVDPDNVFVQQHHAVPPV